MMENLTLYENIISENYIACHTNHLQSLWEYIPVPMCIEICGKQYKALIDSGASINVIS